MPVANAQKKIMEAQEANENAEPQQRSEETIEGVKRYLLVKLYYIRKKYKWTDNTFTSTERIFVCTRI